MSPLAQPETVPAVSMAQAGLSTLDKDNMGEDSLCLVSLLVFSHQGCKQHLRGSGLLCWWRISARARACSSSQEEPTLLAYTAPTLPLDTFGMIQEETFPTETRPGPAPHQTQNLELPEHLQQTRAGSDILNASFPGKSCLIKLWLSSGPGWGLPSFPGQPGW